MKKTTNDYSAKVGNGSHEKTLLQLAWNLDDLQRLSALGREIRTELAVLMDILQDVSDADIIALNIARRVALMQKNLLEFVKGN